VKPKPDPKSAIYNGLRYLASVQRSDGSFDSFSSPKETPFRAKITYQTTFVSALMLSALSVIDAQEALLIRQKLAAWLQGQKSAHWSFNYWARSAPQRQTMPYPDDLDDTFCALIALHEHDQTTIDPACLGSMVKILIAAETGVGGPYRTWLTAKSAAAEWQDIDVAVNSNIACFLGKVAQPPPSLTQLMEEVILSGSYTSPYYPSPYPLFYYIARAYSGPHARKLASDILRVRRNGWWSSPLKTALALAALAALGETKGLTAAFKQLEASQLPNGSWPAEAYCIDPAIQGAQYFSGAPALTTAFALQVLAAQKPISPKPIPSSPDKTAAKLYDDIWKTVTDDLKNLAPALRSQSLQVLARVRRGGAGEQICLLPYAFNASLCGPLNPDQTAILMQLGAANLYGWTAYTVYDDFLDNTPHPEHLSTANFALRQSVRYFEQAGRGDDFTDLVWETFERIDSANAWEIKHCRLPVNKKTFRLERLPAYTKTLNLANRSLGHTLPALGVLSATGLAVNDKNVQRVRLALRHYLVARQLNDDLHDWEEDLRAGIVTYVVTALLQDAGLKPGEHSFAAVIPKLQQQLWRGGTLQRICQTITNHTALARTAASASQLLISPNMISQLVDSIDQSVTDTLKEQTNAEKFLTSFSGTP
jgi:hypothetical protein